jgi:hypothetical protein
LKNPRASAALPAVAPRYYSSFSELEAWVFETAVEVRGKLLQGVMTTPIEQRVTPVWTFQVALGFLGLVAVDVADYLLHVVDVVVVGLLLVEDPNYLAARLVSLGLTFSLPTNFDSLISSYFSSSL